MAQRLRPGGSGWTHKASSSFGSFLPSHLSLGITQCIEFITINGPPSPPNQNDIWSFSETHFPRRLPKCVFESDSPLGRAQGTLFLKVPPNDSDEPRGLEPQVPLYSLIFHIKLPDSNADSRPVFLSMYTLSLWLRMHSLQEVDDHVPESFYLWREIEVCHGQVTDGSMQLGSKPTALWSNINTQLWKP